MTFIISTFSDLFSHFFFRFLYCFFIVCLCHLYRCVRLLLQTCADPALLNAEGLVPGFLAESNQHLQVVELLEEYGGYLRQTDLSHLVRARDALGPFFILRLTNNHYTFFICLYYEHCLRSSSILS